MSPRDARPAPKAVLRYAGALRLLGYVSLLGTAFSCWSLRAYFEEAELAVGRLGDKLTQELGPSLMGAPQTLSVNGQLVMVASRQSPLSVHDVLERFHSHCTGASAERPALLLPDEDDARRRSNASEPARQQGPASSLPRLFEVVSQLHVLRSETETEGRLACFARSRERAGFANLVKDVGAFAESGDIAKLGDLRYVVANKQESGRTHVLTVWTEGPVLLRSLFPESGDAPGADMPDVPRPPSTRRELSVRGMGHPHGFWFYATPQSSRDVLAFYDRKLPAAGWTAVPSPSPDGALGTRSFGRAFVRGDHALILAVEAQSDTLTGISVVDMGAVRRSEVIAPP